MWSKCSTLTLNGHVTSPSGINTTTDKPKLDNSPPYKRIKRSTEHDRHPQLWFPTHNQHRATKKVKINHCYSLSSRRCPQCSPVRVGSETMRRSAQTCAVALTKIFEAGELASCVKKKKHLRSGSILLAYLTCVLRAAQHFLVVLNQASLGLWYPPIVGIAEILTGATSRSAKK